MKKMFRMKKVNIIAIFATVISVFTQTGVADTKNPMTEALKVDGAKVLLPVEAAKEPSSPKFIDAARTNFNNFHWQMGGDHSLYYNMHMSEFMPTELASPNAEYKPLAKAINPELGKVKFKTKVKGELTLDEYVSDPQFRTQGFMLIHQGKIVYEAYPGMKPTDRHIWASAAKTTVGLVASMLVDEGKLNPSKKITEYIPELKGTVWDDVTVLNVLNHTTGFDNEETGESILSPDSPVVRFFASAFGSARHSTGKLESWLDVARDTQKIKGEKAGERFRYASINTIVLTKMIQNIEGKTWTRSFEDRVWGKMTARQPALFNLTPDGMAIAVGLMQTTLEDMARFGTLFTPSWQAVAVEPVVSDTILKRIQTSGNRKSHEGSTKQASSISSLGDMTTSQSYQFDYVYDDGAIAKSGNLGQFIYIDPAQDFVGVVFSTNPYHSGYGESKAPAYMRAAAKMLSNK